MSDIRRRACVVTVRRLNRYEDIQIRRLSGIENFVGERDDFIFNSFRNFKPVKRFQNRSNVVKLLEPGQQLKWQRRSRKNRATNSAIGQSPASHGHTMYTATTCHKLVLGDRIFFQRGNILAHARLSRYKLLAMSTPVAQQRG